MIVFPPLIPLLLLLLLQHLESENARLKARVTELEAASAQQRPAMDAARVKLRELSDLMDGLCATGRLG